MYIEIDKKEAIKDTNKEGSKQRIKSEVKLTSDILKNSPSINRWCKNFSCN